MSDNFELNVGNTVELDGPRYKGKYKVLKKYMMWGTIYYDLEDSQGNVEDFPIAFLKNWVVGGRAEVFRESDSLETKPFCLHDWRIDKWFVKEYKTCTKCSAKYEDIYGK